MRFHSRCFGLLFAGSCALVACQADQDPSLSTGDGLVACTPLTAVEQPIALGQVIAIGTGAEGTLYVVEQAEGTDTSEWRVFVSSGKELQRARVTGSGSSTTGSTETYLLQFELPEDGSTGNLALSGKSGSYSMAYAAGELAARSYEAVLTAGEQLSPEKPSALQGLSLRNLPGEVVVEYNAKTEEGARLVVLRPSDDWTYEDFRVFYGTDGNLSERAVLSVTRLRDGGTTNIVFTLDGETVAALFPASLTGEADAPSLTVGAETLTLTKLGAAEELDALSFRCLPASD